MAAFGVSVSLALPLALAAVLLFIPVVLLVLVLRLPGWQEAVEQRKRRVYVYVPPEERRYPGEVTRPSLPEQRRR
jgi:hypothetical protein